MFEPIHHSSPDDLPFVSGEPDESFSSGRFLEVRAPVQRGAATAPASLYQVRRASDNATRDIGVLSAGGGAGAAAQERR
ncbi:arabinofuranosidase catalytic domain-containing protein [Nonomuraea jabiensis]|uniref:arabinofuranosidase catalytic domain-containing protein n=1 Tax=Nonomuraea jabiensis TaxID=882448 RepID=UPI00341FB7BC